MIFNSDKTIYNTKLQTCKLLNLEYRPLVNTTLNEKFNIYPNYEIVNPPLPELNLITIGGGTNIINNNILELKRPKHGAVDGSLFKHLPLMVKPTGTTLTTDEQNIYRLKTIENINNVAYDVYYGILLSDIDYDPRIYQIDSNEISLNSKIIDTSLDDKILNPEIKSSTLDVDNINNYVINTCKIGININSIMMNNLVNAISIKYPNDNITSITEIGLCSSIDMFLDNHKEAIWTQINYFIDLSLELQLLNLKIETDGNVSINIDIGGMEPLII